MIKMCVHFLQPACVCVYMIVECRMQIEEQWKLYLSASNNMNYYNFTNRHTQSGPTQQRYDREKKFLSVFCVFYRMTAHTNDERPRKIWNRVLTYHSICVLPAPRKTDKLISIFDAISLERYLLILSFVIITRMHASTKCAIQTERTRDRSKR